MIITMPHVFIYFNYLELFGCFGVTNVITTIPTLQTTVLTPHHAFLSLSNHFRVKTKVFHLLLEEDGLFVIERRVEEVIIQCFLCS